MANVTLTTSGGVYAAGGFTQDDGSLVVFPQSNNEVNFGGSYSSNDIWFGYRAAGSRGKPTKYMMGGASGSTTIQAGSFVAGSSRSIKHDIKDCDDSMLKAINKVKIVNYKYNDDETEKERVGFIAEDTDPLFSTDNKHMDINTCIGALIKSVQELDTKIKELEKKKEELLNGNV